MVEWLKRLLRFGASAPTPNWQPMECPHCRMVNLQNYDERTHACDHCGTVFNGSHVVPMYRLRNDGSTHPITVEESNLFLFVNDVCDDRDERYRLMVQDCFRQPRRP